MSYSLSIVILAAGKGSRMKSPKAKVLHEICGREMLYYSIKAAREITDDVIVVVAHQKEAVTAAMEKHFAGLIFVTQDAENFPGTGGAMMGVKPRYEDVLVLNGDMPLVARTSIEKFLANPADIVMSVIPLDNPSGYGRVVIENNQVLRIVEEKDASESEKAINTVNAGVYAFKHHVLQTYIPRLSNANAQGEYYLTDVIEMARNDGLSIAPLYVEEVEFKGVNSKNDLTQAEMIMMDRLRRTWMDAGVIMQLPETIYLEEGVKFEGECIVENGVRLCGETLISNSHIKAHSVIEESIVKNSDVGPLAHLRPLSVLENTHIGNFVEVKKSTLTGVKAGHLSYLGDATIDEGTNIGAGTITCNYDGVKKYQTIIGKNVFVGSDTQLVAPVEIADNVMIAAGTTVTAGKYESDILILSRTPIRKVAGFFTKFFGKGK
ncbi:MAG: bifunctional UDP-N-acetylglucosamine diphosphorylase/glucosamine-1-phosphate N-acetyltransferase GlmU [Sulfuricurvum sp.]|uniref:bifunctional UDP-N-acetylglucosamine diphosphorylase/glucosamine-1-phosphate N-acetyltransferase GlmU n=1 Tax=Sulfuricurvum sp. TaxID=2025608 RepID=UPI002603FDB7|nr:bifunctional UDP-N-acetylglucosamine diphosphorylase/glucosamine-1-phosphate N-acetyltransferase GlmU [Sulfuricurvum sp.]MDD2830436.1 bifunctional UDP-N-acetylglucosamine diphosphorylase/glucosamine-1-phosphate N-acetyltransferase GlmU [Sulfuricurvum sp.]MDD4950030.1 bifunctional UDP-N-acetylglucosamine diphosphorylase/glucosamine-1-phosphate N-acetyltransferase GlmU [Sulfuricurvum sp.]